MRANGVGSRYMFTDHGLAPDKTESVSFLRKELGIVDFEFDSGGPSKINAWVPRTTPSGTTQLWQPRKESEYMEACVDSDRATDRLIRLVCDFDYNCVIMLIIFSACTCVIRSLTKVAI